MAPRRRQSSSMGCGNCPLKHEPGARWCAGFGPDKADLVIVGESPGDTELITGRPFMGRTGELLNAVLEQNGITRDQWYGTNATLCNVKATKEHMLACIPRLFPEIKSREPQLVLTLGKYAFQFVCGTRDSLANAEGALQWEPDLGTWVLPTWHPAAALRSDGFFPPIANTIWRASRFLSGETPLPQPGGEKRDFRWRFVRTPEETIRAIRYYLRRAKERGKVTVSIDTESWVLQSPFELEHGLKPRGKGRPHPERDAWLMTQLYDGKRACAIDMTVQTEESREWLKRLLTSPRIIFTGHNIATYDTRVFRHNLGVCPADERIRDTLLLGLGLSERQGSVGLEPLSRTWLNAPAYKKGLRDAGYSFRKGPQSDKQWRQLARYGVDDVYNGYELNRILPAMVRDEGTMGLVRNVLQPLALTCGRIAARGIPVDTSQFDSLQHNWGGKVTHFADQLHALAVEAGFPQSDGIMKGERFNPNSHPQLAHLAYDVLGLSATDGTTNRKFTSKWNRQRNPRSVDADFLIGHEDHPFGMLMQQYRIYFKLYRTYVLGLLREIDPDGLIHPDFNLAGTATGRLVVKPLLQVLPHYGAHRLLADEDFAAETRRLFPARPGYVIAAFDYKQLEMRVAAALSGDPQLARTLLASDPHAVTARYMFRRETVDDADRHAAKRVTFGVMYNRSAFTLCRGPLLDVLGGVEVPEGKRHKMAQDFIDSFWNVYPDYYQWQRDRMEEAMTEGELTTPFGRKRRWQLITHQNRHEVQNQAVNFPIQSTASDMCSMALVKLEKALAGIGYPLYTVHDQCVTEIREDRIDEGLRIATEVMSEPMFDTHGVQFEVTCEVGANLGDVKKVAVS
jgi:uracil-DNA glycosylase family 4